MWVRRAAAAAMTIFCAVLSRGCCRQTREVALLDIAPAPAAAETTAKQHTASLRPPTSTSTSPADSLTHPSQSSTLQHNYHPSPAEILATPYPSVVNTTHHSQQHLRRLAVATPTLLLRNTPYHPSLTPWRSATTQSSSCSPCASRPL